MMSETTLYLVRHGETDYNRRSIVQGRGIDAVLNATGRAQAVAVAHRLAEVPFDAIYTSPLRRAAETAEAIAREQSQAPLHRLADLEEMAWGVFEGRPITPSVRQMLEAIVARWQNGEFGYRIEDGESIYDVQQRGQSAIRHILAHHAGEMVLVVTHGRFLRILLATLLEAYGLERMEEIPHANTGVNALRHHDGRFEIDLLNCTAHLDAPAFTATHAL